VDDVDAVLAEVNQRHGFEYVVRSTVHRQYSVRDKILVVRAGRAAAAGPPSEATALARAQAG
jgi:hypothetical protein